LNTPNIEPKTPALGGVTRWPIVQLLADGRELTISGVAAVVGSTAENISKQLAVLRAAGVVEWKTGDNRCFTSPPPAVPRLACWITVFAGLI
jgi:predicted transcriptional regulator